ncbi:MAG TPA: hypothetical protein EYQ27_15770 [Gemmatimonadetes bacterium]|nr:hypothetical protein [Gemmatimonadota bacterium]
MKTALHHVPRLALLAGMLGVLLCPLAASAQSDLDTSEATAFIGDWTMPLNTEFGSFDLVLEITDADGKVAASIGAAEFGMQDVTDITLSGDVLILAYEADAQGQFIAVTVTLEPDGDNLEFQFDTAGGELSVGGTATKSGS